MVNRSDFAAWQVWARIRLAIGAQEAPPREDEASGANLAALW